MTHQWLTPDTAAGKTILQALQDTDIPIRSDCGGHGHCGKCRIRFVDDPVPEPSAADKESINETLLQEGGRLACQHAATPGTRLELENVESEAVIQVDAYHGRRVHEVSLHPGEYGVAIDIGTTTMAFALVDLGSADLVASSSVLNPQAQFGADVLSRISHAKSHGVSQLRDIVRDALSEAVRSLLSRTDVPARQLTRIAICGNTTMMYLLRGLDPYPLSRFPFTAEYTAAHTVSAAELLAAPEFAEAQVTLMPGVSAYIGADIVSGLYFIGADAPRTRPGMLVDIGTNGEMVLLMPEGLVCTATAAGPAFEGATIRCGVASIVGAVSRIWQDDNEVRYETIGDEPPVGLCGSAIVDLLAVGLEHGAVDKTGRLRSDLELPNLYRKIALEQQDIRNLQLAKAAIRTGMQMLLQEEGLTIDDIDDLWIAGGFGRYLDKENAARIGLLPSEALDRIRIIGNSALGGAVFGLNDPDFLDRCELIIEQAKAIDLSSETDFNAGFIRNIHFPDLNIVRTS